MKKIDISRTNTVALYNKDEAAAHIQQELEKDTLAGLDTVIEDIDIEDKRTGGTVKLYTITSFHDLSKDR